MPKIHINPETGNPGVCTANIQCRYGASTEHYSSESEARKAYEEKQSSSIPKMSKTFKTPELSEELHEAREMIRGIAQETGDEMEAQGMLPGVTPLNYDPDEDEEDTYYVESIDEFRNPEFAMNRCSDIAFSVEEYSEQSEIIDYPWVAVHETVNGPFLSRHTANGFEDDEGNKWIVDYSYSQVDPKAPFPYVGLEDDWKASLHHAAYNPAPEVRAVYEKYANAA